MSDTCNNFTVLDQDYNLALHIGAVFIILFVSGTACAFPLLVCRIPQLRIPSTFLFFVRHFGTGVLLATAFVHLLPTAFVSLTDPCLPPFWNEKYPAMAGAIAMAAVFAIVVIEMVFSPGRSMCAFPIETGPRDSEAPREAGARMVSMSAAAEKQCSSIDHGCCDITHTTDDEPTEQTSRSEKSDRQISTSVRGNSTPNHLHHSVNLPEQPQNHGDGSDVATSTYTPSLTPSQKFKRETLQCVLLEMGILFHSVFIGMALSVAVGSDFVVLLIAISFHRKFSLPPSTPSKKKTERTDPSSQETFEGLALGSRIATVSFPRSSRQPWLMALAYGCTTPIGQAIGLALHSAYDPASATGLIVVGVMNAVSAGLLTYASLVELMAEDFLSDRSWAVLRGKRRVGACVLVGAGAFCMAIIGAWA